MAKKRISLTLFFLCLLLVILSAGAFFGGLSLISDPSGSALKLAVHFKRWSPFSTFLMPGVILLVIFGIIPLVTFLCMILKIDLAILDKFSVFKSQKNAWNHSLYLGICLIIWINMQWFLIEETFFLQPLFSMIGVLIIILTLMPSTMKYFKR